VVLPAPRKPDKTVTGKRLVASKIISPISILKFARYPSSPDTQAQVPTAYCNHRHLQCVCSNRKSHAAIQATVYAPQMHLLAIAKNMRVYTIEK
jgi:hypothetical protein